MKSKSTRFSYAFICTSLLLIQGCAQAPKNINWEDRRCVKYSDFFLKMKDRNRSTNNGAAFAAFLGGNLNKANVYMNGGGVQWVEGFSGDSKLVWVGYNELGETVGYKDINYTDLTMADLDRLGGVITKYSRLAELDPKYQTKAMTAQYSADKGKSFTAAPIPRECDLSATK